MTAWQCTTDQARAVIVALECDPIEDARLDELRDAITAAVGPIVDRQRHQLLRCGAEIKRLRRSGARSWMSPSALCSEYHMQGCTFCDRIDCCDNISPAREAVRAATARAEQAARELRSIKDELNSGRYRSYRT